MREPCRRARIPLTLILSPKGRGKGRAYFARILPPSLFELWRDEGCVEGIKDAQQRVPTEFPTAGQAISYR